MQSSVPEYSADGMFDPETLGAARLVKKKGTASVILNDNEKATCIALLWDEKELVEILPAASAHAGPRRSPFNSRHSAPQ